MKSAHRLILPASLFLLLCACSPLDPFQQALEGTYEGQFLLNEKIWKYVEGEVEQDTIFIEQLIDQDFTITFEGEAFQAGLESGVYNASADGMSFLVSEQSCPPSIDCFYPIGTFPQYTYAYQIEGDSLVIRVDFAGSSKAFGTTLTDSTIYSKRMFLERTN